HQSTTQTIHTPQHLPYTTLFRSSIHDILPSDDPGLEKIPWESKRANRTSRIAESSLLGRLTDLIETRYRSLESPWRSNSNHSPPDRKSTRLNSSHGSI